jgi:hypothetical protein
MDDFETGITNLPPSPEATYERARRLANQAVWTVALQRGRLRTREPEDREFTFRKVADFQFLIVALTRLRRTAELAAKVPVIADEMKAALLKFDTGLPHLREMRNVIEHIDDYALDQGRDKNVGRRSLEVGVFNDTIFQWLGHELNADDALRSAQGLFNDLQTAGSAFTKGAPRADEATK